MVVEAELSEAAGGGLQRRVVLLHNPASCVHGRRSGESCSHELSLPLHYSMQRTLVQHRTCLPSTAGHSSENMNRKQFRGERRVLRKQVGQDARQHPLEYVERDMQSDL